MNSTETTRHRSRRLPAATSGPASISAAMAMLTSQLSFHVLRYIFRQIAWTIKTTDISDLPKELAARGAMRLECPLQAGFDDLGPRQACALAICPQLSLGLGLQSYREGTH